MILSAGLPWPDWCRRRDFLPVMLRIVMTTTLISLSTPRPFCVIPCIIKPNETTTIVASKILKPSIKNLPLEAKVFKMISMRKMVKKTRSIVSSSFASIVNSCDIVRSKRMKTEYKPIVNSDIFSIY